MPARAARSVATGLTAVRGELDLSEFRVTGTPRKSGYAPPSFTKHEPVDNPRGRGPQHRAWLQWEWEVTRFVAAHGVRCISTSLTKGQHWEDTLVAVGEGDVWRPDVIADDTASGRVIIEAKWQFSSGSAEDKVLRNMLLLERAVENNDDIDHGYLVLGGPSWSDRLLRDVRALERKMSESVTVYHGYEEMLSRGFPHLRPDLTGRSPVNVSRCDQALSDPPSLAQVIQLHRKRKPRRRAAA